MQTPAQILSMDKARKIALQTQLTTMLAVLKTLELPIAYSGLSAKLGTDILSSADLIQVWKACDKIGFDDGKQEIWYKRQFSVRSKEELLNLLKANCNIGGLDVKVLKEGYSAINDAIKELEEAGKILVIKNKDGNPKVVYYNNLPSEAVSKYPSSVEFKTYWDKVEVPDDEEISKELSRAGLSVTDMTSLKAVPAKMKPRAGKARGRKAKITNTHLEGRVTLIGWLQKSQYEELAISSKNFHKKARHDDQNIGEESDSRMRLIRSTTAAIAPEVLWAQRTDELYVTINVSDIVNPQITLTKDQLKFEGLNTAGKKFAVALDFLNPVDPEASHKNINARALVFVIAKEKKGGSYWPRLLKASAGKPHYLKTDFGKWKDEDEDDEEDQVAGGGGGGGAPGGFDMSQFSGMGGMEGLGGLGGMGGMGDLGGMDFSKFGGAEPEGDDSDDDDDDLPGLEESPAKN
ncbi:hypothetical protein HK100_011665 [Physocladia obscura]|uniref:CS domain-containing protein n=1 Tax=Physocladia obscura TaxID=109957 RepID=A0AAD5TA54_9FUNG|nr:hypothetical protein HK100_011665 [Physocladia obscura]